MLARAVDALERLLVQEDAEIVVAGDAFHHRHEQLVVVICQITLLVNRGQLELVGGDLVVARLHRDTQFIAFHLQVFHKFLDARRDGAEVVVVELLVLRTLVAK